MQQIADWLEKLGMSEYAQRFAENGINVAALPARNGIPAFVAASATLIPSLPRLPGCRVIRLGHRVTYDFPPERTADFS